MRSSVMKVFYGFLGASLFLISACSPEVGTEPWCAEMKDKPKGDWSANEAADYAKHCVLK